MGFVEQPHLFIPLSMLNNSSNTELFAGVGLVPRIWKWSATISFSKTWKQWGYVYIIPVFFALFGCRQQEKTIGNDYKYTTFVYKKYKHKYKLKIPVGYKLSTTSAGYLSVIENRFYYSDSSVVYISLIKDFASPNYHNISLDSSLLRRRFDAFLNSDTITLNGRNNKGLYWKEIFCNDEVSIGYYNVSPVKKHIYDNILNNVSKKEFRNLFNLR